MTNGGDGHRRAIKFYYKMQLLKDFRKHNNHQQFQQQQKRQTQSDQANSSCTTTESPSRKLSIFQLQEQIKALEKEKQNWIAFQAYFESQLAKFAQYTSADDFSSIVYTLNQAKAFNNTPSTASQDPIVGDSRASNVKTHFTTAVLRDTQEQFGKFQEQFAGILTGMKQGKKGSGQSAAPGLKQLQALFETMSEYYSQMSALQRKQAREDESIQDLIRENLLLEKQIQLLLSKPGSKVVKSQQQSQPQSPKWKAESKQFERLVVKSQRMATENREETEIYQITTELMSAQIDQLNQQIFQLMEENSRLRGDGERVALEGKELRREKKELEKETEKLRTELTVSSKNRVRTPCNIIITKVDDHHMFNCEQKPIVVTESNQQLEQQLSQLRKALITLDKECKDKESQLKSQQNQIENLQLQIDSNQATLKEKIQENTTYLTQIHELNKMQAQSKLQRAVIAQFQEENERLKQQVKSLQDQLGTFLSLEQETRKRQQSTLKKESTLSNLHKEMARLMEESRTAQETLAHRIIDNQNSQKMIGQLTLERDQLKCEVLELTKQMQSKKVSLTASIIVNDDAANNDEFQRIHQENRQKMIQMKSKLLGLKNNIEKHGEKVGVLQKNSGKSPIEIAKETEQQNQMILQELMALIDQINELQRKIDIDYEMNFTKMNEKQRTLVQQTMQLKQDLKKYQNMEVEMQEKNGEIGNLREQLKMITFEYREYKDIMQSKIAVFQREQRKEIRAEIVPEDIEIHKNLKEFERLQQQLNEKDQEIHLLKEELRTRPQQQTQTIPPEILQQLQQMNMMMMQEDSAVRNAARTIQQSNLEVKQADILHRKINELTEKLSNKNLEAQKHKQERQSLEERFRQEKQEWINQIEKREKQYQMLETKYKKCLEQYEDLQQRYFKLEEQVTRADSGGAHQNTQDSDSD